MLYTFAFKKRNLKKTLEMEKCHFCGEKHGSHTCGNLCGQAVYCGQECALLDFEDHKLKCINAQQADAKHQLMIEKLVPKKVLGEGAYGLVLQSSDNKYAIKIQDLQDPKSCIREAEIQKQLSSIPNVSVAKMYYYSDKITSIPVAWRRVIAVNQNKGNLWAR